MTSVKWLTRITVVDRPFEGHQQAHAYRFRRDEDDPGTPLTRIVAARADDPARPRRLPRARADARRRTHHRRGPRLVGLGRDRPRRDSASTAPGWRPSSTRPKAAGPGAAGAPSGTRRRASTSSPAAPTTPRATHSLTRRTGTSAATPTTASSASRSRLSSPRLADCGARVRARRRSGSPRTRSARRESRSGSPSEARADTCIATGISATITAAATSRWRFSVPTFRQPERDVGEEVQRRRRRRARPPAPCRGHGRRLPSVFFRPRATRTIPATIK